MTVHEQWKPIKGFEDLYEISTLGSVRQIADRNGTYPGRVLATRRNRAGYARVQLCQSPLPPVEKLVHVLVLETFVDPKPEGCEACHEDGNPENSSLSNLRWDTPKNNAKDRDRHGTTPRGRTHGMVRLHENDVLRIRRSLGSQREIAARFGISQQHVSDIKNARRWAHVA